MHFDRVRALERYKCWQWHRARSFGKEDENNDIPNYGAEGPGIIT